MKEAEPEKTEHYVEEQREIRVALQGFQEGGFGPYPGLSTPLGPEWVKALSLCSHSQEVQ